VTSSRKTGWSVLEFSNIETFVYCTHLLGILLLKTETHIIKTLWTQ